MNRAFDLGRVRVNFIVEASTQISKQPIIAL